ncbi:hypothetical protein M404DRAFT_26157 [Pisolithus tinctorius Marx 270]|uniref:Uncharacterized protein n=1 Tax=Pisolithus tinctorius Marx 270 TaxID=870435 RepID=A0A0C3NUX5_PISTI|nr:hypothetical protein M404DRAFT_26157 [Pisolithus tinctorius Marx 270]
MSESHFNFSGSSSLLSPTTSSLLSPATDCVEDPLILSPLQNTSLGLLSGTQQSFASYLPQNLMNQVNDSQVVYLQDCCKMLKQHLVKVTSECNTVRNLFDQLTNMLKSMSCGPRLLDASTPLPALTITDEKAPTCELHPNVWFWTKKDFNDWLESAEAKGSDRGIYAYLEDTNGNVPLLEPWANMQKTLHGAW